MTDPADRAVRDAVTRLEPETLERLAIALRLYHSPAERRTILLRALFGAPPVPADWEGATRQRTDFPPEAA